MDRALAAEGSKQKGKEEKDVDFVLHSTIKSVGTDIEAFSFNTAIARLMELTNAMYRYMDGPSDGEYARSVCKNLLLLLAPFAPHFSEELWERMGGDYSIFNQPFPTFDESALQKEEIEYPLQINGKVRERFSVPTSFGKEELEAYVKENFASYFEGKQVVKTIIVPGKIVNIVVK